MRGEYKIRKGESLYEIDAHWIYMPCYYIVDSSIPALGCVVDVFNLSDAIGENLAQKMEERVSNGDLLGARVEGYACWIRPSRKVLFQNEIPVDKSMTPKLIDMSRFYDSVLEKANLAYSSNQQYKFSYEPGEPFTIKAENTNGVLVVAQGKKFRRTWSSDRRKMRSLIRDASENRVMSAKVEGYQIYIVGENWRKEILSETDVQVILYNMTKYYKEEHIRDIYQLYEYKDMSDEEYEKTYSRRDKKAQGRNIMIYSAVVLIIALILYFRVFLGLLGVIMLFAYADDMFARR